MVYKRFEAKINKCANTKRKCPKIREDIELVFQKLSINKPVFTKEEIAIAADTLAVDLESGQADKQGFQQRLREISKQLVAEDLATENIKESPVQNLTILAVRKYYNFSAARSYYMQFHFLYLIRYKNLIA